MKWLNFLKEYIKSPRTIGAIAPSSERLAKKMIESINFESAECIVEYGPGTGVFTEKLVRNKKRNTILILIEYNEKFCELLKDKYKDYENVVIVNDSAENIDKHLSKHKVKQVDYVLSGLPFASLPKSISSKILRKTRNIIKKNGLFITFQYTLMKKGYLGNFFEDISFDRVLYNLPPAYVLKCTNI